MLEMVKIKVLRLKISHLIPPIV